jgi:hypothetical protein
MRYRVESESKWYKTLRGAKSRAIDVQRGRALTINVVDESGAVVWSSDDLPKLDVVFSHTESITPRPQGTPQPDLF